MNTQLNPEMLILGRELRGLTQNKLAELTRIDQGLISRYEGGIRDVAPHDLAKIAQTLDLPEKFFFRSGQRYGPGSSALFHRKRQAASALTLRMLYARIDVLRLDIECLLSGVEFETPYKIPQYEVDSFDNVEDIASLVRTAWRIPSGPIRNLVKIIEDAGGIICMMNLDTNKIDAITQWAPPSPPIFLVNANIPGDRLRFTLAHEIAHLVMHEYPSENMEEEADQFASAFLMPKDDIESDLEPVTLPHLAQIKPYWKVSIQALIRRAYDLDKITERKYRGLFEQISKLGYRRNEPNPIPLELPTLIREIIDVYIDEHKYSNSELASLLSIHEHEFKSIYLYEQNRLRVIVGGAKS